MLKLGGKAVGTSARGATIGAMAVKDAEQALLMVPLVA